MPEIRQIPHHRKGRLCCLRQRGGGDVKILKENKKIGYIRVSTRDQNLSRQIDGLNDICDTLLVEQASAVAKSCPVYDQLIETLQENDTLVVWDLDRAFRSTIDAVREAERLRNRGIHFQIVSLDVDTTTADGLLMYTVVAAIGQHERMRISERTKEGLAAAANAWAARQSSRRKISRPRRSG